MDTVMTSKKNSTLLNIIENFANQKILVVGEAMLDSYLEGDAQRLCREAPVPVVAIKERTYVPGGAANTAVNLHTLGAQVKFLSVVGDDAEGHELLHALEEHGVSTEYIIVVPQRETLSKQRILATAQILVRFDQGSTEPLNQVTEDELIDRFERLYSECDAIILSDYDYGVLTPRLIEIVKEIQRHDARPLIVDSRHPQKYRELNITAVKPNYEETIQLLGLEKLNKDAERIQQIERHGHGVLDMVGSEIVAITLDQAGALIFHHGDERPYRTYA